MVYIVEISLNVCVQYPIYFTLGYANVQCIQRIMLTPTFPESVAEIYKIRLIYLAQHNMYRLLYDFVFQ